MVDPVGGFLELGHGAQHGRDARGIARADLVRRTLDQIGRDVVEHLVAGVLHALRR
ncbi:MAG: hypothetical protein ACO3JG_06105 [Luteolibacter sp.]